MTISVAVEDDILSHIMVLTAMGDQRAAVETALRAYIAGQTQHHQTAILDLVGRELIDPEYDVRAVRKAMTHGFS